MVEQQIVQRGVRDPLVLAAMRKVPRESFVDDQLREFACDDTPLPIGCEQTISQPYIVAFMIELLALKGGEKVLEIGTGSGYAAAVLAEIAGEVYSIERIGSLAQQATTRLRDLHYENVHVLQGDGTLGCPEHAPYDAIIVAANAPRVPGSLKSQLKVGGRMVVPVGFQESQQSLMLVSRISKLKFRTKKIAGVRFVPLIGNEGWCDTGSQASKQE